MKLEPVMTVADSVAAAIVKGALEAAGIPVMLRAYQSAGWLFPGTPGSLGAMEVLVPADRLEEARDVLSSAADVARSQGGGPQAPAGGVREESFAADP